MRQRGDAYIYHLIRVTLDPLDGLLGHTSAERLVTLPLCFHG
jgi:hypothetical protein